MLVLVGADLLGVSVDSGRSMVSVSLSVSLVLEGTRCYLRGSRGLLPLSTSVRILSLPRPPRNMFLYKMIRIGCESGNGGG